VNVNVDCGKCESMRACVCVVTLGVCVEVGSSSSTCTTKQKGKIK
jgi:hypothetical protein